MSDFNPHLGKKFSKDYQPSKKARVKGAKKGWEYRKARSKMFKELTEVEMPDGSKQNFWEMVRKKLHQLIFDKKSGLSNKEKVDLILKLCVEFMPEDKNVKVDTNQRVTLHFDKEDEKL